MLTPKVTTITICALLSIMASFAMENESAHLNNRKFISLTDALLNDQFLVKETTVHFPDYEDQSLVYQIATDSATKELYNNANHFVTTVEQDTKNDTEKDLQLNRFMGFLTNIDLNDHRKKQKKDEFSNERKSNYKALIQEIEDISLNRELFKLALMTGNPEMINAQKQKKLHITPFESFPDLKKKIGQECAYKCILNSSNKDLPPVNLDFLATGAEIKKDAAPEQIDNHSFIALTDALLSNQFIARENAIHYPDHEKKSTVHKIETNAAAQELYKEFYCFVEDIQQATKKNTCSSAQKVNNKLSENAGAQLIDEEEKQIQLSRILGFLINLDLQDEKRKQKREKKESYGSVKREIETVKVNRELFKLALMTGDPIIINKQKERKLHATPFESFPEFMDKSRKGLTIGSLLGTLPKESSPLLMLGLLAAAEDDKSKDCSIQ